MTNSQRASLALQSVTGFSQYSVAFFQWKVGIDEALLAFRADCVAIQEQSTGDYAIDAEGFGDAIEMLDDTIISLTDEHYSKDKDGNWTEAIEQPAAPVLVVSNEPEGGNDAPNDNGSETILPEAMVATG